MNTTKTLGIVGGIVAVAIIVLLVSTGVSTEIEQRKALEDIEISLADIEIVDVNFSGISLNLLLKMYNPNDITATLDSANFDIWMNDNYLGNADILNKVDIPAYSSRNAFTNFELDFKGAIKSSIDVILERQATLRVAGVAHYDTIIGTLNIPFEFTKSKDFGSTINRDVFETSNTFNQDIYVQETSSEKNTLEGIYDIDVQYSILGGTVKDMKIDSDVTTLIVNIESPDEGSLTLTIPRSVLDASFQNGNDDTFIILIDEIEVAYDELVAHSDSRTITINFEEGDSKIEIIGTSVT